MSFGPKKIFLYSFIGSVTLCAVIGIAVLLFGTFGDIEIRVLFTTMTITVTSLLGLACGAGLEAHRGRLLPIAGIHLSAISAAMCFLIIWNVLDDSEVFVKSF